MVCQQHHASRVKVEYKDAPSCLRVQAGCEYKYTSPCLRVPPGKPRAASRRDEGLRLVSGWATGGIHPRIADMAVDVRVSAVSALCLFPLCRHARPNLHARYGIFGKGPSAVFVIPRLCGGIPPFLLRLELTHVHTGPLLLRCLLLRPAGDTAYLRTTKARPAGIRRVGTIGRKQHKRTVLVSTPRPNPPESARH